MPENPMSNQWKRWSTYYLLLLIAVGIYSVYSSTHYDDYRFNPVTRQSVVDILTPLCVIALFIERAQEVFITSWRGLRTSELEAGLKAARGGAPASTAADSEAEGPVEAPVAAASVARAEEKLLLYKSETKRIAFLSGLALGTLVSIVGIRTLAPLVSWDAEINGTQGAVFDLLDILITGGLLGGGAEGIHRIISVFTDFLDATREKRGGVMPA